MSSKSQCLSISEVAERRAIQEVLRGREGSDEPAAKARVKGMNSV